LIDGETNMTNYANHIGYSDVDPFEVVKIISDKTVEIRAMEAERDDSVKLEFIPGGFSAHCANQSEQKWTIFSNKENPTIRIRLNKKDQWKDKFGRRFVLSDTPRKFYDYNF
jgi:hypothetical protein